MGAYKKFLLIEFAFTFFVFAVLAFFVFFKWFPFPYYLIINALKIYFILFFCALILGPGLICVVSNAKKKKKLLIMDYFFIFILQVGVIAYGTQLLIQGRPIFLVYVVDRFEIVTAADINKEDFEGNERVNKIWQGPVAVFAEIPEDAKERIPLLLRSLGGRDIQYFPKYYKNILDKKEIIVKKLAVINISEVIRNNNYELYLQKIKPHNNDNLILAPVNFKGKFWTVALEKNDMHISSWIDFDPY